MDDTSWVQATATVGEEQAKGQYKYAFTAASSTNLYCYFKQGNVYWHPDNNYSEQTRDTNKSQLDIGSMVLVAGKEYVIQYGTFQGAAGNDKWFSYSVAEYVEPSCTMYVNDVESEEELVFDPSGSQYTITTAFSAGDKVYFKYEQGVTEKNIYSLETGAGSSINAGDVSQGATFINVIKTRTYSLYVKPGTSKIWMQTATPSTEADAYASFFLKYVGCDNTGVNLPSGWSKVAERYTSKVSDDAKTIIIATAANKDGNNLARTVYMYDLALAQHPGQLQAFMEGRTPHANNVVLNVTANNIATTPLIVIISSIAVVSILGVSLMIKRRKEDR